MVGKFAKDTLITFIARFAQLILGLAASIVIARTLGPEGRGVYSLAVLLPTFLITFTQFGFGPATIFYVGKKKYPLNEILGANIVFSVAVSVFSLLIGLAAATFFGATLFPGVAMRYLLLALVLIPFQIFSTFLLDILLGLQRIRDYNIIQLIQSAVFLLLVATFLYVLHQGTGATILAFAASFLVICVVLIFWLWRVVGRLVLPFRNKPLLMDFLSYGGKTYLGNVATFIYLKIDMWMVNLFLSPASAGIYSIAMALSEKIWLVSQSAGTVLFPKVASEVDEGRLKRFTPLVCRNVLLVSLLMSLALFVVSRFVIILLFSDSFLDSVAPFRVLLIGAVCLAGSRIITNDLAGRGKPLLNTYLAVVSVVVNVSSDLLLIPRFGIIGAAWAATITAVFIFLLKVTVYSLVSGNRIRDVILLKGEDLKLYRRLLDLGLSRFG